MAPSLDDHLFAPGRKRILSLDGGGVRGLVTIGLLERVETILSARSPEPREFRLSDYFDLIGGTSTGGIIAALLARPFQTGRPPCAGTWNWSASLCSPSKNTVVMPTRGSMEPPSTDIQTARFHTTCGCSATPD